MEEKLKSLFLKLQDVFHPEDGCENTKERAKNYPTAPGNLAVSQEDKCAFKSLLSYVEGTILKPLSDNQTELLVLTRFEDDFLNQVNCMSVLSSFGFAQGDKTSLEMVKSYIKNHCDQCYPNAPLLMNNLGVMFSENALYEESEDCFNMAKAYCQHQDNIKDAVITLNQAVLKKTLGKYKEAAILATTAASLCHDISMRTTNYAQLSVKLLGRVADMLQEFGNYQMLKKILRTAVHFDIPGADKVATAALSKQLMKIQLEGMDKKIEAKEVKDFIYHLLALLAKPGGSKMSMNAELIRIVIQAAKICCITGQCKEACELLKKLQSIFLLVHGENSFLYGSLLYQMGCFLHACGRFGDTEAALKQAEGILIFYCGESHHSVAFCRSILGSCILLKGNVKDALEYLNKALTIFKKLNPIHPEVGEILLKFAFCYTEEGNFQQAQETLQEAEAIFKLSCGEESCKMASTYFQVGMILQRFKQFRLSAVEKIQKGIEMMVNLGMNLNHPDVMFWNSFLGVLKQSLGMVKEAEKCFTDVQNCVRFCDDLGSKETQILTPEDWFLHYRDRADDRRSSSSFLKAQVISLANLVHMEGGDKRIQYLDKLACCLKDKEIEEIHVRDFAGQDVFLFTHKIPSFNRLAVLIIHVSDSLPGLCLGADDNIDSKMFLASSAKQSYLILFLRIQGRDLEIKGVNCLTSSFCESVKTLFLLPEFRKGFAEGKNLYVELPAPSDIASLPSCIDCLPLLVDLELKKSQEQFDDFDYLMPWQSSLDPNKYLAHVSYFSYRCVNQLAAEVVFDHLIQNLGQTSGLNGIRGDIIADVSPEENVATFIFQESRNLFITIVKKLSVIVKCCTIKESGSNCLCSAVRVALNTTAISLPDTLNSGSAAWLTCEGGTSVLDLEESLSASCSLSVNRDPVGSGLRLKTGNSTIPCTRLSCRSTEADLERNIAIGDVQNKNEDVIHSLHHCCDESRARVAVGLYLLECILNRSGRPVSCKGEELSSSGFSSTEVETSLVEVLSEEEKRKQFGESSSEQRARERGRKDDSEIDRKEAGRWPQKGGTSHSLQMPNNQDVLFSSLTDSDQIVEDIPLLQQGAFPDAKATETSLVENQVLDEEKKHEQFGESSSEQRARERGGKEDSEIDRMEGKRWPQKGGTSCSQKLPANYNNQDTLSSSPIESDEIVEDIALLEQDAFTDEKATGTRDWEREGAKPKQLSKRSRSDLVQRSSNPPVPQFGASSVDSSNESSLSQGRHYEINSRGREQRGQFERTMSDQGWQTRKQNVEKRGQRKERKMQTAQSRSQEDNEAFSQQLRAQYHDQCSFSTSRTEGIWGNIPWSQKDAFADAGGPWAVADRQLDGFTDEFLARHTQDMTLLDSLNRSIDTDVSVSTGISTQGTFCGDGLFRESQDRSQTDPEQNAGLSAQNPSLTLGNLNSAADNENATSDPREYMLNQPVFVSSTDFALGTGTTSQQAIHFPPPNAVMSANITRGATRKDCIPDSLDITGNSLASEPSQQDTSQQYSSREPTVNCELCGRCIDEQQEGVSHQCQAAECHLCLGLIDPSIRCRIFPCGHKFHIICANDSIPRDHDTCPICGSPLFNQPAEE